MHIDDFNAFGKSALRISLESPEKNATTLPFCDLWPKRLGGIAHDKE